jgi:hypothetical protein
MTDIHTIPFKEGKYPTVTVLLQHQINVVSKSAQGTVYGFKPLLLFSLFTYNQDGRMLSKKKGGRMQTAYLFVIFSCSLLSLLGYNHRKVKITIFK